jgi:hypothetical protein
MPMTRRGAGSEALTVTCGFSKIQKFSSGGEGLRPHELGPLASRGPNTLQDLHAAVEYMEQQVEAAVDNLPVPTELQKPLECAAEQFCPYSNTAVSSTCPAGSFFPYASMDPSPTESAINAKRKQMDEVEQQIQNLASMVASMISSVADASLSVDKKRRKVSVAANADSCNIFTAWNSSSTTRMAL